ncbi:hypothetical protein LWI29_004451 [Acer saccharum]|uniref:apyrase n=1 Tax=Acer saccharum TaxID=4024 RepID=A0AA39SWC8_ACESA|nr:hypothetical protein LWI29_004451 [Acer saccharum]
MMHLTSLYVAKLLSKIEIKHPCLHSGYKEQYICSRCASSQPESASPVIGGKHSGKGGKSGTAVLLTGAPNWEEYCSALAKAAVNLSEWSNLSPGMDFYRFFNLTSEAALDDVLEKGQDFCENPWEIARKSVPPQPFIEQYCFRSPYIVLLLREGLHITDKQIIVGSGSITWTLGVALLEAGKTFSTRLGLYSYKILQMKINPIILIAVFLISVI